MNSNLRKKSGLHGTDPAINEENIIPKSLWLAAFIKFNSKIDTKPEKIIRQFYACGFYEAYDITRTYAERMRYDILWFKEKNKFKNLENKDIKFLESICTYCNRKFNEIEPVYCNINRCNKIFCSRKCITEHVHYKHNVKN